MSKPETPKEPKELKRMARADLLRFLAAPDTMAYGSTESGCLILSQFLTTSAGQDGLKIMAVRMEDDMALDELIMNNQLEFLGDTDDTMGWLFGVES